MKVTDNGKIQMDLGEEVSYAGRTYTVVRDVGKNQLCSHECPFGNEDKCPIFACSPVTRDDGKSVIFEEVEDGKEN